MSGSSLRERAQSFVDAGRGIALLVAQEPNARLHTLASVAAIALAIGLVWVAEALNSALEALADAVHPERDARIGSAKDLAAGAVLAAAIVSAVIGALVFGPRLVARLHA